MMSIFYGLNTTNSVEPSHRNTALAAAFIQTIDSNEELLNTSMTAWPFSRQPNSLLLEVDVQLAGDFALALQSVGKPQA